MQYSSLQRKLCKCGECTMMPTISYEGYYHQHAPQEVLDRLDKKTKRKNAVKKVVSKIRNEAFAAGEFEDASVQQLKNDLDYVHSRIVRMTAADARTGLANCFVCGRLQHWTLCQLSHFIPRANTLTRWDSKANRCSCKYCNENLGGNLIVFAKKLNEEEAGLAERLSEISREPYKWTRDELKQLLVDQRAKLRIVETKFKTTQQ